MSRRRAIQVEPPSVTKHIARTLERYPDGGQILKVCNNNNNTIMIVTQYDYRVKLLSCSMCLGLAYRTDICIPSVF